MQRSAGHGASPLKVVLDTNVLLSALLFEGVTSRLVAVWQGGRCALLLTRPILEEYLRALAYPKFGLTERDIKSIMQEEVLPFAETLAKYSYHGVPFLKDPDDRKFLACAKAGHADFLVSGDKVLLALGQIGTTPIVTPRDFLTEV